MRPIILCAAGAALLTGCASAVMDGVIASWQGAHIDEVIARWGYPSGERLVAGRRLVVWDFSQTYTIPSQASTTGTATTAGWITTYQSTTSFYGGGTLRGDCLRILEIDSRMLVVGGSWEGNNCPVMTVAPPYSTWRR